MSSAHATPHSGPKRRLVAGCGAAGAVSLAVGTTLADIAHAFIDPRVLEGRRE